MNARIRDLLTYIDIYDIRDKLIGSKQMKVIKRAKEACEISRIDVYTSDDVYRMGAPLKENGKRYYG